MSRFLTRATARRELVSFEAIRPRVRSRVDRHVSPRHSFGSSFTSTIRPHLRFTHSRWAYLNGVRRGNLTGDTLPSAREHRRGLTTDAESNLDFDPFELGTASAESSSLYSESTTHTPFRLRRNFVDKFRAERPPFGFNGLGELVYRRTYSRVKANGENERWFETVERVVNGAYNMQKRWIEGHQLGWNAWKAQRSAQEMYERIFHMKFLPPGRGLWAMGSPLTEERGVFAALNNCAFVSTDNVKVEHSKPFCFLMDAAMLGVGVGFDTKGAGTCTIKGPRSDKPPQTFVVGDSREGWVESVRVLIDSYFSGTPRVEFDLSKLRPPGSIIRGFGGTSSGPRALQVLHDSIRGALDKNVGETLSVTTIVDLMNLIGRCVVSGNVRQTAEIAFGDPHLDEYIDLKNYSVNPHRQAYGWTSNNSVFAELGMDYQNVCERIVDNGEPGIAWLENMRSFSRMQGQPDNKDVRAAGGNPCLEQTLESYELCCLVETFPANHDELDDFVRTLKFAYLYAKTVTLGRTHWPDTNRVMLRNRRIGCSMSGIAQFISSRGLDELRRWSEKGYDTIQHYDREYSEWLAIPRSIKTTSIKPSGTVSLLAGATPGMHYPVSQCYIRRVRLSASSELVAPLREAGYHLEPAAESPSDTLVVSIPVQVGESIRSVDDVSMWEQLSLAAFLQRHWADNQVSCTVTFDAASEGPELPYALDIFQYQLKGISFLPRLDTGAGEESPYAQLPYEPITVDQYREMSAALRTVQFDNVVEEAVPEKYCDGDICMVDDLEPEQREQ